MRRWAQFWLAMAGLAVWFMPWSATAAGVPVACPAAPIDLMVYGSGSGASADWSPSTTTGETIAAAGRDGVCRTSAWWRTMLGTVLIAVGIGRANRVRRFARPLRLTPS